MTNGKNTHKLTFFQKFAWELEVLKVSDWELSANPMDHNRLEPSPLEWYQEEL